MLPAGGSCLLGSVNLAEFVDNNGKFNYEDFRHTVDIAIRALNDILDEGLPLHPLAEQRESVRDWRQVGLGIMGLSDMLIKMGIRYGSEGSILLCDSIGHVIGNQAIITSSQLAKESESFPKCNMEEIAGTEFFVNHIDDTYEYQYVIYNGLRNSQLLTIAPTGTLSTMLGISGGIEPIFANSYTRTTKSLHGEDVIYKVYTPIVQEYMNKFGIENEDELPEYFTTASKINYSDRIAMQAVWQKHIDASISSTVNLPNNATKEDVFNLYIDAWKNGLKGITVFRDGCSRVAILNNNKSTDTEKRSDESNSIETLERGTIITVSDDLIGKKRKLQTGCGSLHCSAFFDPVTGELMETYLSKGSTGGCDHTLTGLSRMISLAARAGCDIHDIVDQLNSTGACASYAVRRAVHKDTSKGACCPMAVGNAILDMYNEMQNEITCDEDVEEVTEFYAEDTKIVETVFKRPTETCPECGEELIFEGGCCLCKSCGYSRCS